MQTSHLENFSYNLILILRHCSGSCVEPPWHSLWWVIIVMRRLSNGIMSHMHNLLDLLHQISYSDWELLLRNRVSYAMTVCTAVDIHPEINPKPFWTGPCLGGQIRWKARATVEAGNCHTSPPEYKRSFEAWSSCRKDLRKSSSWVHHHGTHSWTWICICRCQCIFTGLGFNGAIQIVIPYLCLENMTGLEC